MEITVEVDQKVHRRRATWNAKENHFVIYRLEKTEKRDSKVYLKQTCSKNTFLADEVWKMLYLEFEDVFRKYEEWYLTPSCSFYSEYDKNYFLETSDIKSFAELFQKYRCMEQHPHIFIIMLRSTDCVEDVLNQYKYIAKGLPKLNLFRYLVDKYELFVYVISVRSIFMDLYRINSEYTYNILECEDDFGEEGRYVDTRVEELLKHELAADLEILKFIKANTQTWTNAHAIRDKYLSQPDAVSHVLVKSSIRICQIFNSLIWKKYN